MFWSMIEIIISCYIIKCRVYIPYPFQWGNPTFNAGEAFAMMAASFVSLFEVHCLQEITLVSN